MVLLSAMGREASRWPERTDQSEVSLLDMIEDCTTDHVLAEVIPPGPHFVQCWLRGLAVHCTEAFYRWCHFSIYMPLGITASQLRLCFSQLTWHPLQSPGLVADGEQTQIRS